MQLHVYFEFKFANFKLNLKFVKLNSMLNSLGTLSYVVMYLLYSCVTWSSYHKNVLASSDYEGTITLWDAFTGQTSKIFQVRQLFD